MAHEPADTALDDQEPAPAAHGEHAETAETHQPVGDDAPPRSQEDAEPAAESDDASTDTTDPLILAQLETPQADEPPKPITAAKPEPKPGTPEPKPQAKPAEKAKETPAEPEEEDPTADLPAEDWQKLSHKSKSQFLSQRKTIARERQAREAAVKEAAQHREQIEVVDRFVKDSGLSNEQYHNGVNVVAAVTRGDPAALPVLEKSIADLRARLGVKAPEPPPVAPTIDFAKLRTLTAKIKGAKQAQPPAPVQTQEPAKPQPQQIPAGMISEEDAVNSSLLDFVQTEGVKGDQVIPYLRSLITEITDGGKKPVAVRDRLRVVMAAHRARQAKAQQPPAKPATAPLSGRGRPVVTGRQATTTNADPLKHAIGRR